jgi:hypothetical protein
MFAGEGGWQTWDDLILLIFVSVLSGLLWAVNLAVRWLRPSM